MTYKNEKEEAARSYSETGRIFCPILADKVAFNRTGFQHLVRKQGIERPRSEQRRRFAILPEAKSIIANPNATVRHHERETTHFVKRAGKKVPVVSQTHFWTFTEKRDNKIITVVVRQFAGKEKHFLTIYQRKKPLP